MRDWLCISNLCKRLIDLLLAIVALPFVLLAFLPLAFCVWWEDGHNPLFVQRRLGLKRRVFPLLKLRSMRAGAANEGTGYYCFEGDDRITRIGAFLRRTSLDEFPQLWNILIGQMSFVGPRPPIWDELDAEDLTDENQTRLNERFEIRPGLTGLAQVSGRNDLGWNQKLKYDFEYVARLRRGLFLGDFFILAKTFLSVGRNDGEFDVKEKK
jgi:lipopolysaccharide/colanic/teichoic acid biosynthesis glycosyltransferase